MICADRFTGLLALVVLAAVACASGTAPQTNSLAISPTTDAPLPKDRAALTPSAPTTAASASVSRCRADQMSAQFLGIEGALGHTGVFLGFANLSSARCVLKGTPIVRLVTTEGETLSLRQESGVYFTDNDDSERVALSPELPLPANPAEDLRLGHGLLVLEWMACPPQPRIARILVSPQRGGGTISIPVGTDRIPTSGAPMCAPDRTVDPWLAVGTFEEPSLRA